MEKRPKITIYSFFYRPVKGVATPSAYVNVWAGKNQQEAPVGFYGDDTGDHISHKNKYYSELTGIYWVWKNTDQEITGSCHYRRFFTLKKEPLAYRLKRWLYYPARLYKKRYGLIYTQNQQRYAPRILTDYDAQKLLNTYDALLPQRRKMRYSVREHYKRYHNENDLNLVQQILEEMHPDYLPAFETIMEGNRLYSNNMFVLPEKLFHSFMEWWFGVLFEFEKRIDVNDYKGYQQRIMGFMGERLLNVWFCHQKLKVKELQVIYFKTLKQKS